MDNYHISVLLQEAIEGLSIQLGRKYIDATLGGGGHTEEILKRGGIVLGIDQDNEAIEYNKQKYKIQIINNTLQLVQGNFNKLEEIAKTYGFTKVHGILFDLGVSSHQFDKKERGFSFQQDAPLDMRMDLNLKVRAQDLINGLSKGELIDLFEKFGEEHFAKRIAQKIIDEREKSPIFSTTQLAKIIVSCYPKGMHKVHPATKVFQALRIAVNDELGSLREALPQSVALLEQRGRVAVISFHSLEDRIVKQVFLDLEAKGLGEIITKKPLIPSKEETQKNKRSRSSKLRIFEKKIIV